MLIELAPGSPGTHSAMFGRCLLKDKRRRLVGAVASTGATTLDNGRLARPVMNAAAADLSLVEAGNVPVLVDHDRSLGGLVGIVEAAWFDGANLRAILRYGTSAKAEAAWRAICDDLPVCLSIGFSIIDIEAPEEDDGPILYTRWRLNEITLTVFAKDGGARVATVDSPAAQERLAQMIETKRELCREQRLAALLDQLGAAEWRAWPGDVAGELSRELGVSADLLQPALARHVNAQLEQMVVGRP